MVVSDCLLLHACSLRTDRLRHTPRNRFPSAAASRGLGYGSATAERGFAARFPCAEPSDCKTMWGGDLRCPSKGREQLCRAFLRPQESREAWLRLPASRSNISGKGELRPRPPGLLSLAAELPPPGSRSGCGMQRLGQPHLARNSSLHCNPGGGVLAIPGGVTSQLPFWGS